MYDVRCMVCGCMDSMNDAEYTIVRYVLRCLLFIVRPGMCERRGPWCHGSRRIIGDDAVLEKSEAKAVQRLQGEHRSL
jgi:hypothetical protein